MPTPAPKTLYLIDGYAQFFRAYHAIRTPMSSPVTKEATNLTFGFIGMLLKLLRGEGKITADGGRADYVAVALDVSGDRGTFRSQIYPEYKATRPPPPEDLPLQVDRCLKTLEAIGVPIIGCEGYEADDVMATLVARLGREHPELRVRMISKDKDLKQLLTEPGEPRPPVELYDIHTDLVIDAGVLKEETGLKPSQVVDMLTLMGDNVDNVPGVDGVGPKTAAQLMVEYGTLENLKANADKVKGKRGEALRAAIAGGQFELGRKLVTLHTDVPVEFDLDAARKERFTLEALIPILKEVGFNRYQDDVRVLLGQPPLGSGGGAAGAAASPTGGGAGGLFGGGGGGNGGGLTPQAVAVRPKAARATGPDPMVSGLFAEVASQERAAAGPRKAVSGVYRCITSEKELGELVSQMRDAPVFAIDTETTALSPHKAKLCGVSVSVAVGTGVYIPVRSPKPGEHLDEARVLAALRPLLEDPTLAKCGHNIKYDSLIFRKHGVTLAGMLRPRIAGRSADAIGASLEPATVFDSMVASYLIDAERSSHAMDALALALLGRENISIKELIGGGAGSEQRTFDTVPLDLATEYAAEDADVTLQLREKMLPQLQIMGLMELFETVEMPLVAVLAELEWNGIIVDPAELDRQKGRLLIRLEELKRQINTEAKASIGRTFNPDSPRQLAEVLFNKPSDDETSGLGLKPLKKLKTGYSTDSEVLEKITQDASITTPIPGLILEHRELSKLVGTYLEALKQEIDPGTKRIHSSFNQTVAATGRLASSDPNLQNIPIRTEIGREIRRAFVAAPGCVLVSADYSQIELRLLAHLSRDPALIEAFLSGQDIHTAVAAQIHAVPLADVNKEQRSGAKMVNFGIVYGVTAFGLARRLGCPTQKADEIIRGYKKRFAGITTFLQECIEQAKSRGYVETMLHRRRPIPDIESTNPSRRAFAERIAINSVVQGSAADLIKLAMIDIEDRIEHGDGGKERWRDRGLKMLLQIHDELVFECPKEHAKAARAFVVERMEKAMKLTVPLKADSSIAQNWFEGK